jgi:hypothetical protein
MKTQYAEGRLSFDAGAFLDSLPAEEKLSFIETLACDDAVIKHVADQLLDGWTESGQHGGLLCTASPDPQEGNALDFQRRRIARRADAVAAKELQRLEEACGFHSKNYERACEEIRELRAQLNQYR